MKKEEAKSKYLKQKSKIRVQQLSRAHVEELRCRVENQYKTTLTKLHEN